MSSFFLIKRALFAWPWAYICCVLLAYFYDMYLLKKEENKSEREREKERERQK